MKNVIFDMDGVIFDSEHVCERCWEDYKEKYKLKDAKGMFHACIGTTIEKTKETMFRFEGPDFPYEEFRKDTSNRFHEIEETEGLPVKKGARELLSWLKESGANVGLASSTRSETVIRQLTHAGLIQYFDVIVGGEMAKKSKPEPDIYIEACRQLKVDPSKAIALEDAINGIRSAHGAGMNPVMIPDIVQDTSKVDDILFGKCESLLEFAEILQGVTLDIEETQK